LSVAVNTANGRKGPTPAELSAENARAEFTELHEFDGEAIFDAAHNAALGLSNRDNDAHREPQIRCERSITRQAPCDLAGANLGAPVFIEASGGDGM
jgi:hypothetical protein